MKSLITKLNIRTFILFTAILLQTFSVTADDKIQIRDVNEIPLDEIGVLDGDSGGLKSHVWNGSNRRFMESLLASMPINSESQIIQKLSKLILISSATPPRLRNSVIPSVFEVKIKKLALMGDYDSIAKMIVQVPENRITESMHRIFVSSFFVKGDYKQACKQYETYLKLYPSNFWSKTRIICNAFEKNQGKVDFDINLLKEQGVELSDNYIKIVDLFAKNKEQKAKDAWNKTLIEKVLKLPEINNEMPEINKYIYNSDIDRSKIRDWLDSYKDKKDKDKLPETIFLISNVEALGEVFDTDIWREFIMFAVSNNLNLPDYASFRLLMQTKSDGERILTIIHILDKQEIKKIPDYLFTQIIYLLNRMGFKKSAKDLAEQRLF
jgi:ACT domain-containing protein